MLWTKTCDGKADTTFEEVKEYCGIKGKEENSVRTFSRAHLTQVQQGLMTMLKISVSS